MTDEPDLALLRPTDLSGDLVPDDIRMKIGELINRWAFIEFQLKVLIRESLNLTRAAKNLLLHGRDLRSLCDLVSQIANAGDLWVPDASLREELESLAQAIGKGAAVRNDFAHGVFAVPKKGIHTGKFSRFLYQTLEQKIEPSWHPTYVGDFGSMLKKATRLGVRAQNATVKLKELKKAKKRKI